MAATEVMHDAFMTYAEHVTLERALPRVEDGLKPVQRRILYTLYELGITPDKPFKKCARIVGEALGKFHPAGDASVYDAMTRMAQDFSMRTPLVDGHGNFGSIDGDSPAAMRYTEARLAPLAMEMLRDLDKDTVPFRPNYDDSDSEPDLLPARYPNLLVNGSSGIAVGLATNIPPHNLGEVIDAVVLRLQKPSCTLDAVMEVLPGPDFPTGGYLLPEDGLRKAYETGRGKIQIRAKTHVEQLSNGKTQIVITEMPYEFKKSALLAKIQQISQTKKDVFGGIDEVRDESDREGMRGVIELKKGVDADLMLNLLYKHTDLQTSYGINMMAIADGSPNQLGLLEILDGYIAHQKRVVRRRTQFDLERAEKRAHILQGLSIAVENIETVIAIIRGASTQAKARTALVSRLELTAVQAQAVLDMPLGRLSQMEITNLQSELAKVMKLIDKLKRIVSSDNEVVSIIRKELRQVKADYADVRRTQILHGASSKIEIDETQLVPPEDCVVILTRDGGLKRMNPRTFQRSLESTELDEKARARALIHSETRSRLIVFTSAGQLYAVPVHQIPEARLKDAGKSLSSLVPGVDPHESILCALDEKSLADTELMYFVTAKGYIKSVQADLYRPKKTRSNATALKEGDRLVYAAPSSAKEHMMLVTSDGYAARVPLTEVPNMGKTAVGVRGIRLLDDSSVVYAEQESPAATSLVVATNDGRVRRIAPDIIREQGRNHRGTRIVPLNATSNNHVVGGVCLDQISTVTLAGPEVNIKLRSSDIPAYTLDSSLDDIPEMGYTLPEGGHVDEVYCNVVE